MPDNQRNNNGDTEQQQEPSVPDPSELLKPLDGDLSYEVRKGTEPKNNDEK